MRLVVIGSFALSCLFLGCDSTGSGTDTAPVADGVDGTDGADGADGADGVDGVDGSDGVDAVDGVDAIDGIDSSIVMPEEITYHNTIRPVMEARCVNCHAEGGIREVTPLDNYETVRDLRLMISEQVASRLMPPYHAGDDCRNYQDDERLSDSVINAIVEWAAGDGVEGALEEGNEIELPSTNASELDRVDVTIEMVEPYSPSQSPDDYRCFLVDWPEKGTKYITGFGAIPGNAQVVHHIIAYYIAPGQIAEFEKYDEQDEGQGYTCYGGPAGSGGFSGNNNAKWLGAWAPGGKGGIVPPGTGIKVEEGSKIALQVHYNVLEAGTQSDRSSVVFKVEDEVENEAFILPWTNFKDWVFDGKMVIPAGENDVMHRWSMSIHTLFAYLGSTVDGPITVYSAALHMHTLGNSGSLFVERANGEEECLLSQPYYDFNWQRTYAFKEKVLLQPGDKLGIECHFDNSQANQPYFDGKQMESQDVSWGDGTTDEMCLGVFYVTGLPFSL